MTNKRPPVEQLLRDIYRATRAIVGDENRLVLTRTFAAMVIHFELRIVDAAAASGISYGTLYTNVGTMKLRLAAEKALAKDIKQVATGVSNAIKAGERAREAAIEAIEKGAAI